jgi:hypothetical protein
MTKCGHPPLDRYTFRAAPGIPQVIMEWCKNCGALRFNMQLPGFTKDRFRRPRAWVVAVQKRKS